jgi:hypothetical protein
MEFSKQQGKRFASSSVGADLCVCPGFLCAYHHRSRHTGLPLRWMTTDYFYLSAYKNGGEQCREHYVESSLR